jgi:hypothetical protein
LETEAKAKIENRRVALEKYQQANKPTLHWEMFSSILYIEALAIYLFEGE